MGGSLRSAARLAVWTAGLLVTGRLLYSVGSDDIRMPLMSLTDLQRWLADTPPTTMAIAVVRLAALVGVAYLLVATALAVTAGLIRARPLEAAARRLTPAVVHRMATGGGGMGLALGAALGSVPVPNLAPHPIIATDAVGSSGPELPDSSPNVATMTRHDLHVATMTRMASPPAPGPAATTARSGPEETGATPGPGARSPGPTGPAGDEPLPTVLARIRRTPDTPGPSPPAAPPPLTATMIRIDGSPAPEVASGASPLPQPGNTWVVGPGDSFWSIAEDVLASPRGDPPGERDVGRYWRRLIDANRARLVDPGNPDLLVPGQELVLPP
ncbi:MAG TPA: LysM domain-containing protein [Acidimicrobiales bacterium]|nr:LysM domain-containing protein [Acidimicrobiales bacterium]